MTINDKQIKSDESGEYFTAMEILKKSKDKIIQETTILAFKVKAMKEAKIGS
jgi:hypothetical protein